MAMGRGNSAYSLDIPDLCVEPLIPISTTHADAQQTEVAARTFQVTIPNVGQIHSRNPRQEALRFLMGMQKQKQNHQGQGKTLIIGIGWGYLIDALIVTKRSAQHFPNFSIFFYEPILQMRAFLRQNGRYKQWQQAGQNIQIVENLQQWWLENRPKNKNDKHPHPAQKSHYPIEIVWQPNYRRYFPNWRKNILALLARDQSALLARDQTKDQTRDQTRDQTEQRKRNNQPINAAQKAKKRFRRLWFHRTLTALVANPVMSFICSTPLVAQAGGHGRREDFIFCGGGPHLIEELRLLREQAPSLLERASLIASDTAVMPLLEAGFPIDLVLSIDSGRGTLMHFAQLQEYLSSKQNSPKSPTKMKIPLLTWMGGNAHLSEWFEEIHYYLTTYPLDQVMQQSITPDLRIWENPSSSLVGLAILIAAACSLQPASVFVAGVSYKHSRRQSHVRGSGYTHYAQCQCNRTLSVTMQQIGSLRYGTRVSANDKENWRTIRKMAAHYNVKLQRISARTGAGHHPRPIEGSQAKKKPLSLRTKRYSGKKLHEALCQALLKIPAQALTETLEIDFDYTEKLQKPQMTKILP